MLKIYTLPFEKEITDDRQRDVMSEKQAHPSKAGWVIARASKWTGHVVILQTLTSYIKCKIVYLPGSVWGTSGLSRIIVWEGRGDVSMVIEGNYTGVTIVLDKLILQTTGW